MNHQWTLSFRIGLCLSVLAYTVPMHLDAKEVDTFSLVNESVPDVTALLDRKINAHLRTAIDASNTAAPFCSTQALYGSIRKEFRNHVSDRFTRELYRSKTFPKAIVGGADSIYAGVGLSAPILWMQVKLDSELTAIEYDGIRIGLDKLEHFFGSGYLYFAKHHLERAALSEALYFGARRELGILGAYTTGVISFADLSANFSGMRFWSHLLNEYPDVIGQPAEMPYISCINERWALTRQVTLRTYVDRTWDETFNCNRYQSIALARVVQRTIEKLSREFNQDLSCESHEPELAAFESKYQAVAPWILNLQQTALDRHFPNFSGHRLPVAGGDES